jgi:cleavage stimulation factor subunit 3
LADARVTFETSVSKLTAKPDLVAKAKPLYSFFHKYESQYGELSQIGKLEQRMAELFPEDPELSLFASRYSEDSFNPTALRPIISPTFQRRPKSAVMQSIEHAPSIQDSPRPVFNASPRPQYINTTNSPKRPFPDDFESELNPPRKLARGESPLKGAAGRRLNEQKQARGTPQWLPNAQAPFVVPRDITYVSLSIKIYETF